jgi:BON domain
MMLIAPRRRLVSRLGRAHFATRRDGPMAVKALSMPAAAAVCGIALGAALEYFLDPRAGRRRRHSARDRVMSRMRRGERRAARRARRAESHAIGIARRTLFARRRRDEPLDDVTLAHKVESELYRRTGVPKGHVSINAEDGVVFLRGIVDREEQIDRAEAAARRIPGVREVENLLHLPGTPAPTSRPKLQRAPSGKALR